MSETVPVRSALADVTRLGGSVVLTVAEQPGSTVLHLESARQGGDLNAILSALGLVELPGIGASGGRDGASLLGIGPSIWLLMMEPGRALAAALAIGGPLEAAFAASLDASHAYTRMAIAGPKADELLAKGCAIDLHPRRFPPGACAVTALAGMRCIIRRVAQERFEILVGRSYAVSLWEWLRDVTAEYGVHPNRAEHGG
jgi:sarcosine oxidase subunit gamma